MIFPQIFYGFFTANNKKRNTELFDTNLKYFFSVECRYAAALKLYKLKIKKYENNLFQVPSYLSIE